MKFSDFLKERETFKSKETQDGIDFTVIENGIINEASLSRILQHHKGSFFIISAHRAQYDEKTNTKRTRELQGILNSKKLGGIPLIGHWQECQDSNIPYDQCPADKLVQVKEYSFLVPMVADKFAEEEYYDIIKELTAKFDQDASLLKSDDGLYLITRNGELDKIGSGTITIDKISQAYSEVVRRGKVKNIPFVFEGTVEPSTINGKRLYQLYGLSY